MDVYIRLMSRVQGPRPPQQARSRASLERILDATEALVESRPLGAITVASIAGRAGVSIGNFYKRFRSKEAVLEALYGRYESQRTETLTRALAAHPRGRLEDRARWLTTTLVRLFLRRRGVVRAFVVHHRNRPGAMRIAMSRRLDRLYRDSAEVLLGAAAEITHADRARAARFGALMTASLCRELILFKPPGHPGAVPLTETELVAELTRALVGYLRCDRLGARAGRRRRARTRAT